MRLSRLALVFAAFLATTPAAAQYVSDTHLVTLQSTGTSVNSSSATELNGSSGMAAGPYELQADAAFYYRLCSTSSCTVTSSNGTLVQAGQNWPLGIPATGTGAANKFLAVISVSGTVNVKVFRVDT